MSKQRIILVALGLIASAILSVASPITAHADTHPTGIKPAPTTGMVYIEGKWYTRAEAAKIAAFANAYQAHLVRMWVATYNYNKWMAWALAKERAAAAQPQPGPGGLIMGRKSCGGDLPPCYVMIRESKGYINIWNGGCTYPCGSSTASGKWQFVRGTWAGYGGYRNAADAPESVQDAKARSLWAGGRGCGHWGAC